MAAVCTEPLTDAQVQHLLHEIHERPADSTAVLPAPRSVITTCNATGPLRTHLARSRYAVAYLSINNVHVFMGYQFEARDVYLSRMTIVKKNAYAQSLLPRARAVLFGLDGSPDLVAGASSARRELCKMALPSKQNEGHGAFDAYVACLIEWASAHLPLATAYARGRFDHDIAEIHIFQRIPDDVILELQTAVDSTPLLDLLDCARALVGAKTPCTCPTERLDQPRRKIHEATTHAPVFGRPAAAAVVATDASAPEGDAVTRAERTFADLCVARGPQAADKDDDKEEEDDAQSELSECSMDVSDSAGDEIARLWDQLSYMGQFEPTESIAATTTVAPASTTLPTAHGSGSAVLINRARRRLRRLMSRHITAASRAALGQYRAVGDAAQVPAAPRDADADAAAHRSSVRTRIRGLVNLLARAHTAGVVTRSATRAARVACAAALLQAAVNLR